MVRQCIARRQRDQSIASTGEERVARDEQRAGPLLGEGRESYVEITFAAGVNG